MSTRLVLLAALAALMLPAVISGAYATHTSTPVITTERLQYAAGEPVAIEGWVEYSNAPASGVLVEVVLKSSDGSVVDRAFVTSDSAGNFWHESDLPHLAGTYVIEAVSHCRDIHRNICTFQHSSITVTVVDGSDDVGSMPQDTIVLQETLGDMTVVIHWTPDDIGKDNIFDIKFTDNASGAEIRDAGFNIMILSDGMPIAGTDRVSQVPGQQKYAFDEPGQYVLRIQESHGIGVVDIPITVVPEFPLALLITALSLAIAIGASYKNLQRHHW